MTFVDKVRENIKTHRLVFKGKKLGVAVSGGADSVALLLAFVELRAEFGLDLVVFHYNHALRPTSVRDQKFVERLASRLNVKFVTGTNTRRIPAKGSIEEFARNIRYDFFLCSAKKAGVELMALAHTQDDLAETVLMRVIRGTGLSGLRSMAFKRTLDDVTFVRPLLNITRAEVESFLKGKRARYVNDPSNRSLEFSRNRIRHKILPHMEKHFPMDVKARLAGLAETAACDYDFIEEVARKAYFRMARERNGAVDVVAAGFVLLHPALRRMVLRLAVASVKGNSKAWALKHVDMMDEFVRSSKKGRLVMPEGLVVQKGSKSFTVGSKNILSRA